MMLIDKLQSDLKEAMLAKDEIKVSTLRMLISAIRYTKNGGDSDFSDSEVTSVMQKEAKKRQEAAIAFRSGDREDSALKEEAESKILEAYLPEQLSNEALTEIVEAAIKEVGATSVSDMGKVIGLVMGKVAGQADGGRVSSLVKDSIVSLQNNK
jgi:uncharacterized protein